MPAAKQKGQHQRGLLHIGRKQQGGARQRPAPGRRAFAPEKPPQRAQRRKPEADRPQVGDGGHHPAGCLQVHPLVQKHQRADKPALAAPFLALHGIGQQPGARRDYSRVYDAPHKHRRGGKDAEQAFCQHAGAPRPVMAAHIGEHGGKIPVSAQRGRIARFIAGNIQKLQMAGQHHTEQGGIGSLRGLHKFLKALHTAPPSCRPVGRKI